MALVGINIITPDSILCKKIMTAPRLRRHIHSGCYNASALSVEFISIAPATVADVFVSRAV